MATKKILKKFIKNGEAVYIPSSDEYVDKVSAQSVGGVKTFTSEPVLPSKTSDAGNNATKPATEAQVYKKQDSLTLPSSPTNGNLVVWGANKKTLADGGAIPTGFNPGNTGSTGQLLKKTASGYEWSDETGVYTAGTNIQISNTNVISATDTTYQASDFDIKDLTDSTGLRNTWSGKQDVLSEVSKSDMDTGTSTTAGKVSAKSIADYVKGKLSNTYVFKGTKANYDALPTTGNVVGDVWNVTAAHTTAPKFPAGSNVAWDGEGWDVLGGVFDTSDFVDKTSAQTISGVKTFSAEPVLPSKTTSATNNGTKPATEKQVYDVAQSVSTLDGSVVKTTGNQTIAGTKTFSTSPVVPSKTSDATNSGTAIATEAQVYKKLDSSSLGNATITVTNGDGSSIGSFTTNQSSAGSLIVPGDKFLDQDGYDDEPAGKTSNNITYAIYEEVEI